MSFFEKIYKNFVCVNLKDYSNIGINLEINKLLFFVTVGLCAACFVINYYHTNTALVIKKLIRADAFGEENSKTLSELGLSDNKSVIRLLSKDESIIKKIVSKSGEKKLTYEEYIELEKQKKLKKEKKDLPSNDIDSRYFISGNMKIYADRWVCKNSGSLLKTSFYCILLIFFYAVILFSMPSILSLINGLI